MRFGILFANTGQAVHPDAAASLASIAWKRMGSSRSGRSSDVVVPTGYRSTYPYDPSGRMPGQEDSPIPDPLIWLTWVAATSGVLRLGTGILILPQRNPLVLAKEIATLDFLSSGRVTLGVGVGWLQEEFAALGVPFQQRGARTDEYIEALRVLWRPGESTYHGRFVRFERVNSNPKPAQAGGIPIAVGGHTEAAARRAGRLGDEFFPGVGSLEQLGHLIEVMRASAAGAGRDPAAIGITAAGAKDVEGVRRLADLGVTRVVIPNLGGGPERWKARLGTFSERVVSHIL